MLVAGNLKNLTINICMSKSSEICGKTRNTVLKIFFRAHLPDLVFLVVCSIYKRNSRLYSVHRMIYFF